MEPWNYRPDDARVADGLILYLIFCEDEVSEVLYFESFKESDKVKINVIGGSYSRNKQVIRVIEHCINAKYIKDVDGILNFDKEEVRVWCVYDNDIYSEAKKGREALDFRVSVDTAIGYGLNVAWSNDAFEIWILLHFHELDYIKGLKTRNEYYAELTNIFEEDAKKSLILSEFLKSCAFNYKDQMKSKRAFKEIVLPILIDKMPFAIHNAKELHEFHKAEGRKSCDAQVPCTMIFKLVEELITLRE